MGAQEAPLLTVEQLAEALRCHVETLRRRIRRGQLKATRNQRGAYLIHIEDAERLFLRKGRPVYLPRPQEGEVLKESWMYVAQLLWRLGATEELEFMYLLKEGPDIHPPSYRLLNVHRLRLMGRTYAEIAAELGISVRHACRLDKINPVVALRASMLRLARREIRLEERWKLEDQQEVVDKLRVRLEAEGIRPSTLTRADLIHSKHPLPKSLRKRSRRATVRPDGTPQQIKILRAAGLTDEEVHAVLVVGLTPDELNALMLRGMDRLALAAPNT